MTRPGPRRPRRRAPADRRAPSAARRPPQPRQAGLGGDQVEGRRAVLELLRAGRREVKRVFVAANVEHDDALDEIVERAGARLQVVPPQRLEQLAGTDAPQGVVARAAPLRESDLEGLLARDDAFLVALDGVTDPGNLGAIARVAETAGATGLVVARHRSARLTPAVTKAAAGAIEYLAIATVGGIPAALDRSRRAGVWTVGLDERGDRDVHRIDVADQRIVLVLGAEGRGLARLTRERCDVLVRIPTYGRIASLNVATAAAIACHEVARRRNG